MGFEGVGGGGGKEGAENQPLGQKPAFLHRIPCPSSPTAFTYETLI